MRTSSPSPNRGGGQGVGLLGEGEFFRSRYQIVAHLGSGLVGNVFQARDLQDPADREGEVALKILRDSTWARAIRDEQKNLTEMRVAERAAGWVHSHIPRLIEAAPEAAPPYIALELMRGQRLVDRLAHHSTLSEALSIHVALQLSRVLQLVHEQLEMTYIDLKLENLWWEPDPERNEPYGLLRLTDWNVLQPRPTVPAPQAGEKPVLRDFTETPERDPVRRDLFIAGLYLYRFCVGQYPQRFGQIHAGRLDTFPRWSRLTAGTRNLLERALDDRWARRPADAAAFAEDLRSLFEHWISSGEQLTQAALKHWKRAEELGEQAQGLAQQLSTASETGGADGALNDGLQAAQAERRRNVIRARDALSIAAQKDDTPSERYAYLMEQVRQMLAAESYLNRAQNLVRGRSYALAQELLEEGLIQDAEPAPLHWWRQMALALAEAPVPPGDHHRALAFSAWESFAEDDFGAAELRLADLARELFGSEADVKATPLTILRGQAAVRRYEAEGERYRDAHDYAKAAAAFRNAAISARLVPAGLLNGESIRTYKERQQWCERLSQSIEPMRSRLASAKGYAGEEQWAAALASLQAAAHVAPPGASHTEVINTVRELGELAGRSHKWRAAVRLLGFLRSSDLEGIVLEEVGTALARTAYAAGEWRLALQFLSFKPAEDVPIASSGLLERAPAALQNIERRLEERQWDAALAGSQEVSDLWAPDDPGWRCLAALWQQHLPALKAYAKDESQAGRRWDLPDRFEVWLQDHRLALQETSLWQMRREWRRATQDARRQVVQLLDRQKWDDALTTLRLALEQAPTQQTRADMLPLVQDVIEILVANGELGHAERVPSLVRKTGLQTADLDRIIERFQSLAMVVRHLQDKNWADALIESRRLSDLLPGQSAFWIRLGEAWAAYLSAFAESMKYDAQVGAPLDLGNAFQEWVKATPALTATPLFERWTQTYAYLQQVHVEVEQARHRQEEAERRREANRAWAKQVQQLDETLLQDDADAFHNALNLLVEAGPPFPQFRDSWAAVIHHRLRAALTNVGPNWQARRRELIALARRATPKLGDRSATVMALVVTTEAALQEQEAVAGRTSDMGDAAGDVEAQLEKATISR